MEPNLPASQVVCGGRRVSAQLQPAVLEAEPADTTKPPTRKELKNLLRLYFTVRRPVVKGCGHKIDTDHEPRGNCQVCWFAWFNCHGELVQNVDKLLHEPGGDRALVGLCGNDFLKNFRKFMSTIAQWKAKADKENNVQSTTGTENLAPAA